MTITQEYDLILLLFAKITISTLVIPVLVSFLNRKRLNRPLKIFLYYCIALLLANLMEQSFVWVSSKYYSLLKPMLEFWKIGDSNFLQIIYYLIDFTFLGWFYYTQSKFQYTQMFYQIHQQIKFRFWVHSNLFQIL